MQIQVPTNGEVTLKLPKDFAGSTLIVKIKPDGIRLTKALVIGDHKPTTIKQGELS